ncbi:MAG: hypothetical protein J5I62_01305, partial [Flavobacteriales bacterium]|nr:hypothetical protein [Flavobacteriales bacterium]
KLEVYQDRLFIIGGMRFVNHLPTPGIASWDGTDFCTLGGGDNPPVAASSFTFYHDSLYMSVGSNFPGRGLVRYLSTDFTHECSTLGWEELTGPGTTLQAHWSPTQGLALLGLSDGPHELRVFDAQGRLVLHRQVQSVAGRSQTIPFNPPGSALYLAVVDGRQAARFTINR